MKRTVRILLYSLFLLGIVFLVGEIDICLGQPAPDATSAPGISEGGGLRHDLAEHGITPSLLYRTEIVGALTHRDQAQHDVTALTSGFASIGVDAAKLAGLRGNALFSMQTVHGTGLNEDALGGYQLASNLDSGSYVKLIEAWYADNFWGQRLGFKVGRQYADTDFGVNENAGDFLNAGYGVLPTAPMPTYPNPQFGVMGFYAPTSWASFGAGAYRGDMLEDDAGLEDPRRKGLFTITELKLRPAALKSAFRFGGWRQGDGAYRTNLFGESMLAANYGAYAAVDYWPLHKSNEEQSPALFARWGWAPTDRNSVHGHLEGGFTYPALFPGRKQDAVGLGFTQVSMTGAGRETVLESYYKLQINRSIALQPDMQWAIHPMGVDGCRAVAGLRFTMLF